MNTQQQYQSVVLPQQKSTIQKLLDDNSQLILSIIDLQSKGKQNECHEYERTLHRNLSYLTQFDSSTSHHPNILPVPDAFIQSTMSGNIIQQSQSDQMYRTSSNSPHKPTISPQRSPYLQQGKVPNNNAIDSSYSIQQNGYGQHPSYHPQQNYLMQQQWQNQPRMTMQPQQQQYSSSYQQLPPQT